MKVFNLFLTVRVNFKFNLCKMSLAKLIMLGLLISFCLIELCLLCENLITKLKYKNLLLLVINCFKTVLIFC